MVQQAPRDRGVRKARLEAARRIFTEPAGAVSVGDVALYLGFTHLGPLGADYKAAFGDTR